MLDLWFIPTVVCVFKTFYARLKKVGGGRLVTRQGQALHNSRCVNAVYAYRRKRAIFYRVIRHSCRVVSEDFYAVRGIFTVATLITNMVYKMRVGLRNDKGGVRFVFALTSHRFGMGGVFKIKTVQSCVLRKAILINGIHRAYSAEVVKVSRCAAIVDSKIVCSRCAVFVRVKSALMFEKETKFLIIERLTVFNAHIFLFRIPKTDAKARCAAALFGGGFSAMDCGAIGDAAF